MKAREIVTSRLKLYLCIIGGFVPSFHAMLVPNARGAMRLLLSIRRIKPPVRRTFRPTHSHEAESPSSYPVNVHFGFVQSNALSISSRPDRRNAMTLIETNFNSVCMHRCDQTLGWSMRSPEARLAERTSSGILEDLPNV